MSYPARTAPQTPSTCVWCAGRGGEAGKATHSAAMRARARAAPAAAVPYRARAARPPAQCPGRLVAVAGAAQLAPVVLYAG